MISKSALASFAGLGTVVAGGGIAHHYGAFDGLINSSATTNLDNAQQTEQQEDSDVSALNSKLTPLELPNSCKFTNSNKQKVDCSITKKDDLKKIKFSDLDGDGEVTVTVDNFEEIKIEIKKLDDGEKTRYGDNNLDLIFLFKEVKNTVTLTKSSKTLKLVKEASQEFKINDNKLEKVWTAETLIKKIDGFSCEGEDGSKKCKFSAGSEGKQLKVNDGDGVKTSTITSNKEIDGFTFEENEDSYNQGFKFKYTGENETQGEVKIFKDSYYQVKYDSTNNWYLEKKNT